MESYLDFIGFTFSFLMLLGVHVFMSTLFYLLAALSFHNVISLTSLYS